VEKILGLDIGTTNIKGELYDTSGSVIDSISFPYQTYFEKQDWAEQDARDWLEITIKILNTFLKKHKNIVSAGISTQGGTLIPVDGSAEPLRRAITWMDARGAGLKEKVLSQLSLDRIYRITGWRLQSILPLLQISWLKENEKHVFSSAAKYMLVSDFVQEKLCGKSYMDYSNASISMLFDIIKRKWSGTILDLLGLNNGMLSEAADSHKQVGYLNSSRLVKNAGKVLMSNSGHDQYCVALGTGTIEEGTVLLSTGTSWAIFLNTSKPCFNDYYYAPGIHVLPGKYGLISVVPTGGTVHNWFFKNFFDSVQGRSAFLREVEQDQQKFLETKDDCIFFPTFSGMYGPEWDDSIRGSFINLGFSTDRRAMFKAVLEGVSFQLALIFDSIYRLGLGINAIKMIGGAAKSRMQAQLIADITGRDIYIPKNVNISYACRGAAVIGAVSAGIYKDYEDASAPYSLETDIIRPREAFRSYYLEKFTAYRKVLKGMLQNRGPAVSSL
jgi:xylulokinase